MQHNTIEPGRVYFCPTFPNGQDPQQVQMWAEVYGYEYRVCSCWVTYPHYKPPTAIQILELPLTLIIVLYVCSCIQSLINRNHAENGQTLQPNKKP